MKREELEELVDLMWWISKKMGYEVRLQFISTKIVSVVPAPYELKEVVKNKVEFEDTINPVFRVDSDDVSLKVLTLKPGTRALVSFKNELIDMFCVEVLETFGWEWGRDGIRFIKYRMADPTAKPVKYDDPLHIMAIATGLWTLQNLNSEYVTVDPISGSKEKIVELLRRIVPELEYIKKFKIE
jgi:hypothetical protein